MLSSFEVMVGRPPGENAGSTIEKYIWDGNKVVSVSEEWLRSHKHRHGTVGERLAKLKVRAMYSFIRQQLSRFWYYVLQVQQAFAQC